MKINRRRFVGGVAATAVAAGIGGYAIRRSLQRPNIILFIADDMRYDAAGFAGNSLIKTPSLDWLASQGFTFDNSFVTTSVCPVSRASIMSGEYALRHRVYNFNTPLKPETFAASFPMQLRAAGYYTGFVGKWGLGGPLPKTHFDFWRGYKGQGSYYPPGRHLHATDLEAQESVDFLRHRPPNRPFLLIVSFKAPHVPLEPQARYAKLYEHVYFMRARNDTPENFAKLPPLLQEAAYRDDYKEKMGTDVLYEETMKKYYRLITGMDDAVGRILREVYGQNATYDTSVLFTSDNGLQMGAHRLSGKWCMLEDSIRVPLVIRPAQRFYDSLTPGRVKAMALNIDLAPTILSMARVGIPPGVEGRSLLPLMRDPRAAWREGFYYEYYPALNIHGVACIGWRGGRWKYSCYFTRTQRNECLFDLANDPSELNNLAGKPELAKKLDELRRLSEQEREALM